MSQVNAEVETPTEDHLDCHLRHDMPQAAWEIEKGKATGLQLELTLSRYAGVDKSWAEKFSQCKASFKGGVCCIGFKMFGVLCENMYNNNLELKLK